jgi:hypothetical protein
MKQDQSRYVWGGLLVVAGILFLLQELNILSSPFEYLWMLLMAAGSAVFLWIYFTRKDQWWAIIPGLTLLGLTVVTVESLFDFLPGSDWVGAVFLGSIGLAFWLVYLRRQDQWWAIIPGGVMLTLSLVAGLDSLLEWSDVIFFLGLGGTFFLVALLPGSDKNTKWAYIPAGVLTILGLVLFSPIENIMNIIWPILLIGLGVLILLRSWKQ